VFEILVKWKALVTPTVNSGYSATAYTYVQIAPRQTYNHAITSSLKFLHLDALPDAQSSMSKR